MKNEPLKNVLHIMHIAIVMMLVGLLVYSFAPKAFAQTITTPYWCGSYWSSTPCNYSYNGYQNYYNGYPYNYYSYPYQYQYGYPYQYYSYPAPTCNITYSYTNNPNYWSGGMYNQAIQLTWTSNYATSAYISGVGTVSQAGTRVVYPYGYVQYAMTVYGPGGQNTCTTYYQPQQYYQPNPQYYWNQYNYNYGYNYGYPYAW